MDFVKEKKIRMYQLAALCSLDVYQSCIDLGTTEFNLSTFQPFTDLKVQVLSIAGTNEKKDWVHNINPMSINGIKKSSAMAANEIMSSRHFTKRLDLSIPLMVTGHSKGGATAIAFHKLSEDYEFKSGWCNAFAPARCLRYWSDRKMDNTTIFIDPDDPVSILYFLGFGLPICERIKAPNDHFGLSVSDHPMDNWVEFTKNMKVGG